MVAYSYIMSYLHEEIVQNHNWTRNLYTKLSTKIYLNQNLAQHSLPTDIGKKKKSNEPKLASPPKKEIVKR